MDAGERWKTIAVIVLAFGFLAFASRPYLSVDSFNEAAAYGAYAAGTGPANAFYQITGLAASAIPLSLMAPVFGTLAILFVYLALRQHFGSTPALIASALLASAPAFTHFASAGIYSPEAMAFAFFALGAYLLLKSTKEFLPAHAGIGAVSIAISALIYPNAALLAIIFAVAFVVQTREKPALASLAAAAACIYAVGPSELMALASSALASPNLRISLFSLIALLPIAACALVPYMADKKRGARGMHEFSFYFAVLSLLAAVYSPYLALFGLAFACAYSVKWVLEEHGGRRAEMAFLGIAVALVAFPLLYGRGFAEVQAASFSLLIGAASGFLLTFYEGRGAFKAAAYAVILFLLFSSFITGAVLAQAQFSSVSPDVASALEASRTTIPGSSSLYGFGISDEISYIAQKGTGNRDALIAKFLLTDMNASALKSAGIDYLLVDASYFDDLGALRNASGQQGVRMDSFLFGGYARDQAGIVYAVFIGRDSQLIAQANEQTGQLTGSSYSIRRLSGESFEIAASRVMLLKSKESAGIQPYDRMVYPGDSYDTNLFNLYFAEVEGMQKVYPKGEGAVRIYKVG